MTSELISKLEAIVGKEFIFTDDENRHFYGKDETEDLVFLPGVVVKPANAEQISAVCKLAYETNTFITPRGAGTGLSGGCLPVHGGIVLSTERLNKILKIDTDNFQVITETGVVNEALQNEVRKFGLYYPPDPSSKGSCFIGGNLSESSGGPKAVKYGVTRDYVLNMEVVLPDGEIIWTGANTLKYASGYNLTHLMIGSEGTLGIITKVVLRLIPAPHKDLVMLVPFHSSVEACQAVNAIMHAGIKPSALEFMEREALEFTMQFLGMDVSISEKVEAHLLIEVDGGENEDLMIQAEKIYDVLQAYQTDEPLLGESSEQKELLWKLRRNVAHGVKANSVYKEEDTVVPRATLPQLLKGTKEIAQRYGFKTICFGHAGDGNLHIFVLRAGLTEEEWAIRIPEGIKELFELTVKLGGTISGEHGIGLVQKEYLKIALQERNLELMRGIKKAFDPKGLLNPGKIF